MRLFKKYIKIGLIIYSVLAIAFLFFDAGNFTEMLQHRAARISHPINELVPGWHTFNKHSNDAIVENVTYYIFYSDTALHGKSRKCYFLASKGNVRDWPSSKYIVTDNLSKYTLITSKSVGNVNWRPLIADAIIDGSNYHYDLAGPPSSYDLEWEKRSRSAYIVTKGLFILAVPYDILTIPLFPIKFLTSGHSSG